MTKSRSPSKEVLIYCDGSSLGNGAAIGLAYLDDDRAIPAIDEAIQKESVSVLRNDMEAIRRQLAHR